MPVCGRCQDRGGSCSWLESRRGLKGGRKDASRARTSQTAPKNRSTSPLQRSTGTEIDVPSSDDCVSQSRSDAGTNPTFDSTFPRSAASQVPPRADSSAGRPWVDADSGISVQSDPTPYRDQGCAKCETRDTLVDLFYERFFPAHPFVIPRKLYLHYPSMLPEYLKASMRFLASHYLTMNGQEAHRDDANSVFSPNVPDDGFKVQTLLLLAIASLARAEPDQGQTILEISIKVALRVGMDQAMFAVQHGGNDYTLQESWRRTWWDLYVVDGLVSAINTSTYPSQLRNVRTDVLLPGSCNDYNKCSVSMTPLSHNDMRNRAFSEIQLTFSSFAYKVEAMHIMHKVLELGPDGSNFVDTQVEAMDVSISNFLLSLPQDKKVVLETSGKVDEVLLAAHMIIQWAAITLHRPRSALPFVKNYYQTACTNPEAVGLPVLEYAAHTSKVLRAANAISNLTATQSPLAQRTPCFACAIAAAATTHLPAYVIPNQGDVQSIMERLQLAVSALGSIAEVWPLARIVRSQIAEFARELISGQGPTREIEAAVASTAQPQNLPQINFNSLLDHDTWLSDFARSAADTAALPEDGWMAL